jgi:hypothetical protein
MTTTARAWAYEEFGGAELGDRRRNARLVQLATAAAAAPAGTITSVVGTSAEREGAFRLLESEHVSADAVRRATHASAARRCEGQSWVYVALDGSTLALTDRIGRRDVGGIGAWHRGARGLHVATALAVLPDGTPVGVCGQRWWARGEPSGPRRKKPQHSMESETRHGVELLADVRERFALEAPGVEPWLQLDRGFDAWAVLLRAREHQLRLTVRAAYSRCVRASRKEPRHYLFDLAAVAPKLGSYRLEVPARAGAPARLATMDVRAREVTLELKVGSKRYAYVTMRLVSAKERRKRDPIHWILLTTVQVNSFGDARAVIDGYATRWRVEEFHRAWKRGVCNVEDTQLRSREAIIKWATILAAVAARASRLTYLAREKPTAPATDELSREEIDAIVALRQPQGVKLGAQPTLEQAVRWIADLGGYTGKSSGGPPGPTVVARGFAKVEILAEGIRELGLMR